MCKNGNSNSCDIVFSSASCPVTGSCSAYFADTVQGNSASSKIKFENQGRIFNDPDTFITFPRIEDKTHTSHKTCYTDDCKATGTSAPALSLPSFEFTNSSKDLDLEYGSITVGPGGDHSQQEYKKLVVEKGANVTFLSPTDKYVIGEGEFKGDTTKVTFNAGEYWFDKLKFSNEIDVFINHVQI